MLSLPLSRDHRLRDEKEYKKIIEEEKLIRQYEFDIVNHI